jgi:hypothetical protein
MFTKILIANHGNQSRSGAAAQLNCLARKACSGDFSAKAYKGHGHV